MKFKKLFCLSVAVLSFFSVKAESNVIAPPLAIHENEEEALKELNLLEMILHHVSDAHEFHLLDYNDVPYSLPLPIILYTQNGLSCFLSSEFHHDNEGKVIVEKDGLKFSKIHEKIYIANQDGQIEYDDHHHPTNAMPLDLSITKNVFSLFLSLIVLGLVFMGVSRFYKKNALSAPRGIASFVEPIVIFVRDDIVRANISHNPDRFVPYILTLFLFIWVNNIFGLIPFFPFSANLSGNIAFTASLAVITFIITNFLGNKNYWGHIFWMPGVPIPLKIFLIPIELMGIFIKPVSLAVRLFANITAGHIIVMSLISLIFIFKTILVSPASIFLGVFIFVIEIVVTAIQAYIFALLSALYIGMSTERAHH